MIDPSTTLRDEFTNGLIAFLNRADETARLRAYTLGRRALEARLGLLDLVSVLHHALAESIRITPAGTDAAATMEAAEEFLHECVSAYEMAFRGALEVNDALRRQNELLEQTARRIARETHDSSAQLLASVHAELYLTAAAAPPEISHRLVHIGHLLDGVEEDLRRLSRELRPTILDDLGLLPALRTLAAAVSERTGLSIRVCGVSSDRLPPRVEVALYRIVQEALANVHRHAHATRADVDLLIGDREVRCVVCDDGVGFASVGDTNGLGLAGMRERVGSLGGWLSCSNEGNGCGGARVEVVVPLEVSYDAGSIG